MRKLLLAGVALLWPCGVSAQVVEYYHLDALGSVRAITSQAGAVIERHDYLPFGEEHAPGLACPGGQSANCQRREFTGKERDAETGQDYFGARYYGAKIGRFTTVDPVYNWNDNLVDPQRWNRYAYVRNNPFRYVDPDGKDIGEAAAWVQRQVSAAANAAIGAAVHSGSPAISGSATFVVSALELGANGVVGAFRVGESTGTALGRGDTGLAFAAAVSEDAGRAGGLILMALAASPRPAPAGAPYFEPGPFAGEGTPVAGPGPLRAAAQRGVNAEGDALGCHHCGATSPGTKSGNWVGDHQPVSVLNTSGAAQRAYPHCLSCSRIQGGYASQAAGAPAPASAPTLVAPQRQEH